MKKILYLISSFVFFLVFSSNVNANKVYSVRLNYDTFSQVLESDSRYSTIIDYINNKLRNSGYYYYIESMRGNYNECNNSNKTQAEYNNYCDLEYAQSHGGYRLRVIIINPSYYSNDNPDTRTNDIPGFYFFINGGPLITNASQSGWFTFAPVGFSFGSDTDSDDTKLIRQPYDMPNGHTTHIIEFNSVNDLSNLDSWLNNPVFDNGGANFYHEVGYSRDNLGLLDYNPFNANFTPMFIYKNFRSECKYAYWLSTRYNTYFELYKNNMTYYKGGTVHTFKIDSDPEFIMSDSSIPIDEPIINNLGDDNFQISSSQILISHSSALSTINCPLNTEFNNNFCYTNNSNYSIDSDIITGNIFLTFDFGNGNTNVPYLSDNFYLFTFRTDSSIDLDISHIFIYSGLSSNSRVPIRINKFSYGAYTDYQVLFKSPSGSTSWSVNRVAIRLNSINSSNLSSFYLGIYNKYTYKQVGTSEPSLSDLNNFYNNNSIDTTDNSSSSWFTGFHINDRGLSSIITAPFRYFRYIINSNGVCSSLTLPTYYFGNIQLPCVQAIIYSKIPDIVILYRVIMSGLICYYVIVGYYKLAMVCFNPTDSRIEVVDL